MKFENSKKLKDRRKGFFPMNVLDLGSLQDRKNQAFQKTTNNKTREHLDVVKENK